VTWLKPLQRCVSCVSRARPKKEQKPYKPEHPRFEIHPTIRNPHPTRPIASTRNAPTLSVGGPVSDKHVLDDSPTRYARIAAFCHGFTIFAHDSFCEAGNNPPVTRECIQDRRIFTASAKQSSELRKKVSSIEAFRAFFSQLILCVL
jgi:hypothetical protein